MTVLDQTSRAVLVTQAATRNGYVITYSLGSMGIPVYCADSSRFYPSRFSRYCCQSFVYPSPHCQPDAYFDAINDILADNDIQFLFPAYDEAFFLAQHRERLFRPDVIILPPLEHIQMLHNKPSFYRLCEHLHCRTPRSFVLESETDLTKAAQILGYPLVLKPERGGGGWGVSFVEDEASLKTTWRAFDAKLHRNRLFAQEHVQGPLFGFGAVCDRGMIIASSTYQIVRQYPLARGTPCHRRGANIEEMNSAAQSIYQYLNWTGVGQIDFILDEKDGRVCLLDANPRFWGSVAHAYACGINVPFLLYEIGKGRTPAAIDEKNGEERTSTWFWGDFMVLLHRLKGGGMAAVLNDHFASWKGTFFDDLRPNDPVPFMIYPLQYLFPRQESSGF